MAHKLLIFFLVFVGLTASVSVLIVGWDYYTSPQQERVFRADHKALRPSGEIGHTLGVIGATMIIVGVAMYSTRKRVKALWTLGKISTWLDVHIFLCLLGPILIIYHSTFKAGGIAAISLWSMLSVVSSGIIGRFLYILLPRNAMGVQIEEPEINKQFDALSARIASNPVGRDLLVAIDKGFAGVGRPETILQTIRAYTRLNNLSRSAVKEARMALTSKKLDRKTAGILLHAVRQRIGLIQRSIILGQVEQIFYYWHVIHLPFAIIMFLTLAVHVGVALWLGYAWIF